MILKEQWLYNYGGVAASVVQSALVLIRKSRPTKPPAGTATRRDGVRDVHWTLGSSSAYALGVRDVRLRLTHPICAIFKYFSGLEFSLLPSRVHVRPSATAHRASSRTQTVGQLLVVNLLGETSNVRSLGEGLGCPL